ncbi:MAG: sugar ABC transporter ATP-binding protein [Proteobacteria bacterium]|nr:sugar ABC transporter ATP-binding protein [Pseudomonadota bacterium]
MAHLLEMTGVSKAFPGVKALTDVSIFLDKGEVLGIVGENGAGKSTLMKIVAGVYTPDDGELRLEGEAFAPRQPRDSLDAGIIVIHQELSLVPDRSVAENIFLGNLPHDRLGRVRRKALNQHAKTLLARVGLDVAPQTRVRQLGIAQQQLVEIARALSRQARVIVMDEPTATLTTAEQTILFATIRALRSAGVGLVFISHHLEEVFEICDRVVVLRDGAAVEMRPTSEWNETGLIQAMVNRPIDALFPPRHAAIGDVVLAVEGLTSAGHFEDVSLELRAGEVLGLAGLIGAGRTEVLKAIYGALPISGGRVRVQSRDVVIRAPRDAIAAGVALVPEDRKAEGLVLPFSIRSNVAMSTLPRLSWLRTVLAPGRMDRLAEHAVADLRIRASGIGQTVQSLSGGNQQKVVIGRALTTKPRIFLLDEPTRGIDVGAKVEVYRLINALAEQGAAILVVSSDMIELLGLCDRILIMRTGRIAGAVPRAEFSQERIMHFAALG